MADYSLIKVKNVKKSFLAENSVSLTRLLRNKVSRFIVFDDVSFEVKAGELLGILGRNGAGKSTLLRTIGGVYGIDKGEIITHGDIVSIFELGTFFNPELTGERYAMDYLRFRGMPSSAVGEAVRSIQEFTELGEFFYEPVKTYSSGMQAKLLFGVATASPAKIVLIDEALVVGDEAFQGKAWKRLKDFLAQGATGIIVSHDWTSLMKLCKRTLILSDHKVEFLGSTYEAVQKYLSIPFQQSDILSFRDKERLVKEPIQALPGQAFIYSFRVAQLQPVPDGLFGVTFSIERHIDGIGWSLALVGGGNIWTNPDQHDLTVTITIEDFCLAPGDYLLCLGLTSPLIPNSRKPLEKVYESLTWLNGHPIPMTVHGDNPDQQLYVKGLKWTLLPA